MPRKRVSLATVERFDALGPEEKHALLHELGIPSFDKRENVNGGVIPGQRGGVKAGQ